MNKNKILAALVLLLIGAIAFLWGRRATRSDVSVELSKDIYKRGEEMQLTVGNNSFKKICFSTCFPYYLQYKEENWNTYNYPSCSEKNLNMPCVSPGESKTFSFSLNKKLREKIHRLAIPINRGGEKGSKFEEDQKVHSEIFDVK